MRGVHRRPKYQSNEHAVWFQTTSKRVLYELLKDITLATQFDSYESDEAAAGWLANAKDRQRILKQAGII